MAAINLKIHKIKHWKYGRNKLRNSPDFQSATEFMMSVIFSGCICGCIDLINFIRLPKFRLSSNAMDALSESIFYSKSRVRNNSASLKRKLFELHFVLIE